MDEHLVRSHLGCFYISSLDPEFIEMYCETCGDYDQIEASWDSEDEKGKIEALSEYFSSESIKTNDELKKRIDSFEFDKVDNNEALDYIIDEIEFNNESNMEIIEYLHEDGDLSEVEYNELINRNKNDLKKQFNIIKNNINNYIISKPNINKTNKKLSLILKKDNN